MILRYRRLPAICALVAALLGGLVLAHRRPVASATTAGLADLERVIAAGDVPAETWYAYAQKLLAARDFARAASAYQQVLRRQPYHRPARFEHALTLAQSPDRDAFFACLKELVYTEPKLAVELLDRPELAPLRPDPRMAPLQTEARSQAMD